MLLASLTIGVMALPYARPTVCDLVHQQEHGTHARHVTGAWAPIAQADGCHGLMRCGVADAGSTFEAPATIVPLPAVASRLPVTPDRRAATPGAPQPPPPRS